MSLKTSLSGLALTAVLATVLCALASAQDPPVSHYRFFGMGDWDHDGHVDLVARNPAGDLMLYPGESKRAYSQTPPIKIGNGWNGFTFFGMGDWDHDGHLDLVARNAAGDLMLYPGESQRAYSQTQPIKIGNGWNGFTFFGMGDWDHDGHLDLVARNAAGDLMLYPGESKRAYSQTQPIKIGNGWNGFTFFGMGDWDHDGHLDLVARNAAGDLMLYPGESKRAYSQTQPIKIGNGWNGFAFFGMGDWDHDGHLDLVARNTAGDLMLYPGESQRAYSQTQPIKIGNDW
ncbi:MAG: VCBS repeat-containing protein [Caulobacter sp.]|nr:VCBS repeat-containing protein [Caulobacter sp.]